MNPPNDPRTKQQSLPYTPDADTAPQSATPDRTEPGADGTGIRFGPPAAAGEIGTLGRFRIKKELGRGGMGAVFLALDTRLERQIALKVMLPQAAANQTAKDRFIREARSAARISHDNVISILDADELDGVPFIALPYLQGYPLDQFLKKKGNPSIAQAMRMGREMALGLAAAHDLGIVHRDIKPGNIWLEAPNGRVKILDFGLAKPQDDESGKELTHSGAVMGTPAYMAPEQAAGLKVDHRADLYSLGTVLYRLVTGRTPFERPGGMMALLTALAIEPPARVEEFNAEVPPTLAELIHQLLHKDREQRPQSAKEVAKRLAAVRDNPAVPDVSLAPSQPQAYVPVPITLGSQSNAFADIDSDEATQREPRRKDPTAVLPATKANRKPLFAMLGVGFVVLAVGGYALSKMLKGPSKVPEVVEKKLPADEPKKDPTKDPTPRPAPKPPTPVPIRYDEWIPVTEFTPVKAAPRGPLDDLDPAKIPEAERFPGQPKELVAVAGSQFGLAESDYAFSPDGKRFATVGVSGVKIFETDTLKLLMRDRTTVSGRCMAVSPDGKLLGVGFAAPGTAFPCVNLYSLDGAAPALVRSLTLGTLNETEQFVALAFSDDGKSLSTATAKRGVVSWDLSKPTDAGMQLVVPESGSSLHEVRFATDLKTLATADVFPDGRYGPFRIWNVVDGIAKLRCEVPTNDGYGAELLNGGKWLAKGGRESYSLWNVDANSPVELAAVKSPSTGVKKFGNRTDAFCTVQIADRDTTVWSFDTALRKVRDLPRNTVAVSPDASRVIQGENSIHRVYDAAGKVVVESGEAVTVSGISPALGRGLFTFAPLPKSRFWTVRDGAFQPGNFKLNVRSPISTFVLTLVSPDGQSVVGRTDGGKLLAYTADGDGLRDLARLDATVHDSVHRFAWGPDSRSLYFGNGADGSVYRWKPFEGNAVPEALVDLGFGPVPTASLRAFAVSPGGKLLAVATPRGVELLDLANEPARPKENWLGIAVPKVRRTPVPDSDPDTTTLAFSPGNRFLYFNAPDKTIRRVDLSHPQLASNDVVAETPLAPNRFEFAADAKILVTVNGMSFQWWDTATEPFKRLGSYAASSAVTHWQLAPDGRHLLIAEHGAAYVLRLTPPPAGIDPPKPAGTPPPPAGIDPPKPAGTPPPPAGVPAKWVDLTAGKKLSDWDQFVTKGWSLKNGILEADGSAQGWVGTKTDYTDFELELEYRLPPKGNSGIFLRAWENNQPMGSEFVEIQLLDDAGYPAAMTGASQRNGSVFRQVAPNPAPRFKVNQWNTVKLTVVGKRVTATFNDVKCIDADVTFARMTGRVGLQHYRTGAEFRNVRIREK